MTIEDVKAMLNNVSKEADKIMEICGAGLISESDADKMIDRIYVNFTLSLYDKIRA